MDCDRKIIIKITVEIALCETANYYWVYHEKGVFLRLLSGWQENKQTKPKETKTTHTKHTHTQKKKPKPEHFKGILLFIVASR